LVLHGLGLLHSRLFGCPIAIQPLPSNGRCLQSHYLPTGLHTAMLKLILRESDEKPAALAFLTNTAKPSGFLGSSSWASQGLHSVCCVCPGCRLVMASNAVASSASVFTALLAGDCFTTNSYSSHWRLKTLS
jgi:hypothetical protein